jgi:hypothetical protein
MKPDWSTNGAPDPISAGVAFRVQELIGLRDAEMAKGSKPKTWTATMPVIPKGAKPKGVSVPKLLPNGVKLKGTK